MITRLIFNATKNRVSSNFKKESLQATKAKVSSSLYSKDKADKLSAKVSGISKTVQSKQATRAQTALIQRLIRAGARPEVAAMLINKNQATLSIADLQMSHAAAAKLFDSLVTGTHAGNYDARANGASNGKVFASLAKLVAGDEGQEKGRKQAGTRLNIMTETSEAEIHGLGSIVNTLGNALLKQIYISSAQGADASKNFLHVDESYSVSNKEKLVSKMTGRAAASVSLSLQKSKQGVGISLSKVNQKMAQGRQNVLKSSANAAGTLAAASRPLATVLAAPVAVGASIGALGLVGAAVVSVGAVAVGASPFLATKAVLVDGITGGPGLARRAKELSKGNDIRNNLGLPSAKQMKSGKDATAKAVRGLGSMLTSRSSKVEAVSAI